MFCFSVTGPPSPFFTAHEDSSPYPSRRDYNQDGVIDYDEFCYIYNEVSAEQSYADYSAAAGGGGGGGGATQIASSIDAIHDQSLTKSQSQHDMKGNTGIFNVNVVKCMKLRDPTTGMFAAFTYANPYVKVGTSVRVIGRSTDRVIDRANRHGRAEWSRAEQSKGTRERLSSLALSLSRSTTLFPSVENSTRARF